MKRINGFDLCARVCVLSVCVAGPVSLSQCACSTKEMKSWPSTTCTLAPWRRSTCTSASLWRTRWIHPPFLTQGHMYKMWNSRTDQKKTPKNNPNGSFQVKVTILRLHGCRPLHSPISICSGWPQNHPPQERLRGLGVVLMALPFCEWWVCSLHWPLSPPEHHFPRLWAFHFWLRLFQRISNAAPRVTVKLIKQGANSFLLTYGLDGMRHHSQRLCVLLSKETKGGCLVCFLVSPVWW